MGVHIPKEEVERARQVGLLDFLSRNRPEMYSNIVRVGGQYAVKARYYGTKGIYSSFMIKASTGDWWHHSKGTHGRNALDYLIKEEGLDFQSAVFEILGTSASDYQGKRNTAEEDFCLSEQPKREALRKSLWEPEKKQLVIPEKDSDTCVLRAYLNKRGISDIVIDHFLNEGSLYQGAKYKNVCFVGFTREGKPGLINQRATKGAFKGNSTGSDRKYSFMNHAEGQTEVHLFEAPIDLLSYATLIEEAGYDFRLQNLVSLSGISGTGSGTEVHLPVGMKEYLERYPETTMAYIHFDNDSAGQVAANRMKQALDGCGIKSVFQFPPEGCKDANEYLVKAKALRTEKERKFSVNL